MKPLFLRCSALALAAGLHCGALAQEDPLQRAEAALQAGDYDTAASLYGERVTTEPENLVARFGLGRALFLRGDAAEALPHLEFARDASGGAGIVQYFLGQTYFDLERFGAADTALGVAATEQPDLAPLAFLRAEICYRLGRGPATARRLRNVIRADPDWGAPHLRLGAFALDEQRYDDAVAPLERALQLQPTNVDAALLLAVAHSRMERPELALQVLEAAASSGDSVPAKLALAERYEALARADDLKALAGQVLTLAPGHPVAEFRIGRQLSLEGETEAALEHARTALRGLTAGPQTRSGIRPGDVWRVGSSLVPEALRLIADLQERTGDRAGALATARRLVAEYPLSPDGHFALGTLLLRERDDSGREHLRRFKQLTDARVHGDLGSAYLQLAQYERAVTEFRSAYELEPNDPATLVGLARGLRETGEPQAALGLLEAARSRGGDPTAWYTEAVLTLAALDRDAEAMTAWEESRVLGLELTFAVHAFVYRDVQACDEPAAP